MKKIVSVFLCFLLVFSTVIFPVYAANEDISIEQMRDSIISQGLFRGYVNTMTDLQVEELYNNLLSGDSEIIIVENYTTMDLNEDYVNTYGLINQDNFGLSIGVVVDYDTNDRIKKAAGLVSWKWNGAEPAGRRDDLLHISWEPSDFTFTSEGFGAADFYTKHSGEYIEYNQSTLPAEATTRDMVVYTNVYSGFGVDRGGWCVWGLNPAKPMYKGTNYSTPLSVTYYHNKSMIPYVNDISFSVLDGVIQIGFQNLLTDTFATSMSFEYS